MAWRPSHNGRSTDQPMKSWCKNPWLSNKRNILGYHGDISWYIYICIYDISPTWYGMIVSENGGLTRHWSAWGAPCFQIKPKSAEAHGGSMRQQSDGRPFILLPTVLPFAAAKKKRVERQSFCSKYFFSFSVSYLLYNGYDHWIFSADNRLLSE